MRGCVGGHDVGADVGTLGVWTGGTSGVGGLHTVLLVMLFILLVVVLLIILLIILLIVPFIVLPIMLSVVLIAVFVLLGVFVLELLVFIQFFVFLPFIIGFIGATSLVSLGSGRGVGLSSHVIIGWCGLLARGAVKGSMWGCDTDATGGQHALSTNIEIT